MRSGFLSFNRVPMNIVFISIIASYAAQFLAIIQGFPLWGIALATLLPWVPVFTLEMMWRYRHLASATQHLRTARAAPGEVIVREGEPADRFFIITSGNVEVVQDDRRVAQLGPGEYFGEIGLLAGEPRAATVRATAPTELLALDRTLFRSIIANSAETVDDLQQVVQQRVAALRAGA